MLDVLTTPRTIGAKEENVSLDWVQGAVVPPSHPSTSCRCPPLAESTKKSTGKVALVRLSIDSSWATIRAKKEGE